MTQTSTPTIQISRKGMFIWIGMVIFISFWMFVLGVMVGRGMTPVNLESGQPEKELAEIRSQMVEQEQAEAAHRETSQSGEKPQLDFYEALKKPGKASGFKPAKPVPTPAVKPSAKRLPVPPAAAAKPVAKPPAVKTPELEPKSKPASEPKETQRSAHGSAEDHFSIQVAAVQDIKAAGKLVNELRNKGYHAYQIRSEVAGKGVWYRIRVGGFEDRGGAEKVLRKLKGDKYGGMVVNTK